MSKAKSEGTVLKYASFRAGKIITRHMYVLLLIPLLVISYPLTAPGIPITLDFPTIDSTNYPSDRLWAWWEKGSTPGLEGLSRFPIFGLWHALGFIGLDVALLTKLNVVIGFFIASFSFYFSFWLLFKDKFFINKNRNELTLKAAAILGALFYAYNPWSFERVVHWYLWIGYALLPLFLLSTVFVFRNPGNWKYILPSIFLWSLASTTPHMTVFYGIIFTCTFFAFVIDRIFVKMKDKSNNKKVLFRLSTSFLTIVFLFSLFNFYWIYPYVLSSQIRSVSPNYLLVEENLEDLSKQNDIMSTLTLIGNWQEQQEDKPFQDSTIYSLWFSSGIVIPIFAFSALLFSRRLMKFAIIFAFCALVGIVLAMGTQSPFDYFKLMLVSPLLTKYLWLFRDPDKWSFLIAFGYSFLIGITSYSVLQFFSRVKHCNGRIFITSAFLFLIVGTISLYAYPVYRFNMYAKFNPIVLPSEFDRLNAYLSNIDTDKIYFIPYPLDETQWNKLNRVGDIYQMHSIKPSIESTGFTGMAGMGSTNYYNYLEKSIIGNRSKNIGNYIYPLGTSYVVFHNDTWDKREKSFDSSNLELLRQLYDVDELKNINNIGFYKVFKADSDEDPRQFNVYGLNIATLGGFETLSSLNAMQSFSSQNSSLLFVDDIQTNNTYEFIKNSDYIILEKKPSLSDLVFSSVDDNYIVQPFAAANRYEPLKVWSKSGATDPDFGNFHPHLEGLGIKNWEFDYGKGLVITQAAGAKISLPVEIGESGDYDIFLRYLKNQKGGIIKVYFDNKLIDEINTEEHERSNNNFVWKNIGSSLNLTEGKHTIILENVAGFNAINILTVIPTKETTELVKSAYSIAEKAKNIYLLEAESDFYNIKGKYINSTSLYLLSEYDGALDFNRTWTGQFRIPANADLMSLQFLANGSNLTNNNLNNQSYYSVKNLEIYPGNEENDVFTLDFDRNQVPIPLAALRQADLTNRDGDALSTSLELSSAFPDTGLRVIVKRGGATDWSIISTDFIPVNDKKYYNFSLDLSAKDVNQLHTKVVYYDSDKRRIKSDSISEGRDGTFSDTLTSSIVPPLGAKYVKYEILVLPNTEKASSYLMDDLKFEEIIPQTALFNNDFASFQNVATITHPSPFEQNAKNEYAEPPMEIVYDESNNRNDNGLLKVELSRREGGGNMSNNSSNNDEYSFPTTSTIGYNLMQTKPIPVKENAIYNYTISVEGQNLDYLAALASFRNSSDVVENSTKYGANASNGKVLSLRPGSEIYTYLDVLKASNYTMALRASTCSDRCSHDPLLRVSIVQENPNNNSNNVIKTTNIPLKDHNSSASASSDYDSGSNGKSNTNAPQLKWVYLNNTTYLEKGKYEIKIHSDSKVDLDSVMVYSIAYEPSKVGQGDARKQYETLEDLFNPSDSTVPAYIADYKKIDPTKYEVKIKNATRPYVMSLAESYDPLWVAYTNTNSDDASANDNSNLKKRSIPLFSIINGFYITKTGDYTLTVEYEPQKWLLEGGIISASTVISILAYVILSYRKKRVPYSK